SPFGFHIIEVLERAKMKPPLAEVRTSLTAQLEAQRLSLKLEELRKAADIQTIIEAVSSDGN
ncbi:MAG: peptidylprolyl isomerase, partial [Alphaproteobacteria bacterium]